MRTSPRKNTAETEPLKLGIALLLPLLWVAPSCRSQPAAKPAKQPEEASTLESSPYDAGASDAAPPVQDVQDPQAFVDLSQVIPGVRLDMRYASENNFAKKVVYPAARCLVRAPVGEALLRVQARLRKERLQILLWDCYRPFHVQEAFWKLVPDSRYVARPVRKDGTPHKGSKHNRGAAVDITLATLDGVPLAMPTDHDDFSERAHRNAKGIPVEAAANAARLAEVMSEEGFAGIDTEWWHFDYQGWQAFPLSDSPL